MKTLIFTEWEVDALLVSIGEEKKTRDGNNDPVFTANIETAEEKLIKANNR